MASTGSASPHGRLPIAATFHVQSTLPTVAAEERACNLMVQQKNNNQRQQQISPSRIRRIIKWMTSYKSKWVQEMRGNFFAVAMVLVSVSWVFVSSPPGGLWQQSVRPEDDPKCSMEYLKTVNETHCLVGTPVNLYGQQHDLFIEFMHYNVGCLVSAIIAIVFIFISAGAGDRGSRFALQIIEITSCISLFCLGFAILDSILLVIPKHALNLIWPTIRFIFHVWALVMIAFAGLTTVRLVAGVLSFVHWYVSVLLNSTIFGGMIAGKLFSYVFELPRN